MAPPSSLLRDLLVADGFKNRRSKKPVPDNSPTAPRAVSMPPQHRRPTKPSRSQSDVLTHSRLRDDDADDGQKLPAATRRSSASLTSARSYQNKNKDGNGSTSSSTAIPCLDESALSALISLAAGSVKQFGTDEAFRAALRAGCTSCVGESNHRAVLDLRVIAQTVERAAAAEEGQGLLDPRDLKRASLKLHALASLGPDEAQAVTASGVPHERLAACAHLYMSVVSRLQRKDHSSAVHALEAFCLAPREARTVLLPALWDRLFRPALSHLRAWRDREFSSAATAAASSVDAGRVKKDAVEKAFLDALDGGTRSLACYYRDWLLGRTEAMALPSVPAPPSTALLAAGGAARFSSSTTYDIGSDVAFSSGSQSPAMFAIEETPGQPELVEKEEIVEAKAVDVESVFHECDGGEASSTSYTPTPRAEEHEPVPNELAMEASEPKIEDERSMHGARESTSYLPIRDMSAIDLLTLEFCEGSLRSGTDGDQVHPSIFSTTPSDFLCPLTRQIFNRPVTIETGQTFERHAIVQWLERGIRACPVTGQELETLSVPDTNRVLKRLIDSWKSEHCKSLQLDTESRVPEEKLNVAVVDQVLDSGCDPAEQIQRARHLMAIGGVDFHLHRFQEGTVEQKARAAEHLLLCIQAEGGCRNYVAVGLDGESAIRLVHSEVVSARSAAVRLLAELLCLRRREMVELVIRGLCTTSIAETMNVLLQHLRSSPVEEQALVAVLLLYFDHTLEEPHRNSKCREEAARILTESLTRCVSDENVVPNTRKALLILGGHFSFSGDLLAEHWMLEQAGFVDDSSATSVNSDAAVQDTESAEEEAWPGHVTTVLLGSGRRPFLAALSRGLISPNAGLAAACLTTAAWLSRSLASLDATDTQLAAFAALVPRLKQCLAGTGSSAHLQARHRVLAAVTLHNFSKIPDCRVLLMLLADGLRDHLAELAELTRTAGQLYAELSE
ncbi:putative E3 ubiquitin-protein ligase LIN-1 [Brachypodium distachyon]|uniref:putative E3 ubiquitin-protein ligase LIN-1 n=1 Tax=Brachypodium distachyon TaxID=15368 RepID=UPI00052FE620|nr:putative E3 ubiquitin-protein ligase LIN-1 [Brachypodium distachyon]|eukprot:XP_010240312.1 putative E3 ubiquitin-protein ligase LIN-1 [Brachypodium distachyon]